MKSNNFFIASITVFIYIFCILVLVELGINYFSFKYLFPIKNATSYGYMEKSTFKTVIPLNKYSSRYVAQLCLPYELIKSSILNGKYREKLINSATGKYGYQNEKGKIVIDFIFDEASEYYPEGYAIAGIKNKNSVLYGTIDNNGNWVIKPKYMFICPFDKYHTKACVDAKHCGVIDRFGGEVTTMSFDMDKFKCDKDCNNKFCSLGQKKEIPCK